MSVTTQGRRPISKWTLDLPLPVLGLLSKGGKKWELICSIREFGSASSVSGNQIQMAKRGVSSGSRSKISNAFAGQSKKGSGGQKAKDSKSKPQKPSKPAKPAKVSSAQPKGKPKVPKQQRPKAGLPKKSPQASGARPLSKKQKDEMRRLRSLGTRSESQQAYLIKLMAFERAAELAGGGVPNTGLQPAHAGPLLEY